MNVNPELDFLVVIFVSDFSNGDALTPFSSYLSYLPPYRKKPFYWLDFKIEINKRKTRIRS